MMITQYLQDNDSRINNWLNTHVLPVIKANPDEDYREAIEHCIDFLKSKESPKKITRLGFIDTIKLSEEWTVKLNNKKLKAECDESVEEIIVLDQYRWVKLLTEESFSREGKIMQHCVASYFGKNKVEIYSLRDSLNEPHCTIEVISETKVINQVKGKQNRAVIGKYHKAVIDFVNNTGCKIREYELKNFGAIVIEDILYHIDDIPEESTIKTQLTACYFSKLPKNLKIKGNINLYDSLVFSPYDISGWEIASDTQLKGVNIKQETIKSENNLIFSFGTLQVDSITSKKILINEAEIEFNKIDCDFLTVKKTPFDLSGVTVRNTLELDDVPNELEINEYFHLKNLICKNIKLKINTKIKVDSLDLDCCEISDESLINIEVVKSVQIKSNSPVSIPPWNLESFADLKATVLKGIASGFTTSALFIRETDQNLLLKSGVSFNPILDSSNKRSLDSYDVKEAYFLK